VKQDPEPRRAVAAAHLQKAQIGGDAGQVLGFHNQTLERDAALDFVSRISEASVD